MIFIEEYESNHSEFARMQTIFFRSLFGCSVKLSLHVYRPSDRVQLKNANCMEFAGQIMQLERAITGM